MKRVTFILLSCCLMLASCGKDEAYRSPFSGDDNRIAALTVHTEDGAAYAAVISDEQILLTVPDDVSFENAKVTYTLTENASVQPKFEAIADWSQTCRFLVTSYSQKDRIYTYKVRYVDGENRESVVLRTQDDVTAFGRSGQTTVSGNLIIGSAAGGAELSNIDALQGVTVVKGSVIVNDSYRGETLDGLSGLESAGGLVLGGQAVDCPDPSVRVPEFTGVTHSGVHNIYLASLREVTGTIRIYGEHIRDIHFPELETVGLDFLVMSNDLQYCNIPRLRRVKGALIFRGALAYGNGGDEIVDNNTGVPITQTSLNHLEFPMLESAGSLSLRSFHKVAKAAMPNFREAGYIHLYYSAFTDYTDFAAAAEMLDYRRWNVTDCDYNPSWQDMHDKKYTPKQ